MMMEFADKLDGENERRKLAKTDLNEELVASVTALTKEIEPSSVLSTNSGTLTNESDDSLQSITYDLHLYPSANHNLTPGWDEVVARDISFYTKYLVNQDQ